MSDTTARPIYTPTPITPYIEWSAEDVTRYSDQWFEWCDRTGASQHGARVIDAIDLDHAAALKIDAAPRRYWSQSLGRFVTVPSE